MAAVGGMVLPVAIVMTLMGESGEGAVLAGLVAVLLAASLALTGSRGGVIAAVLGIAIVAALARWRRGEAPSGWSRRLLLLLVPMVVGAALALKPVLLRSDTT